MKFGDVRRPLLCLLLWPLLSSVLATAAACAHKPPPDQSFDEQLRSATRPVPADLQAEVTRAEQLGEMLHTYDSLAWLATDALLEGRDREQLGLGGYIVLPEGDEQTHLPSGVWQAVFYSRAEPPKILYRVRLQRGQPPEVKELQPAEDPVAGMDTLIRARATALSSLPHVAQPMNPVLMPGSAISESGILVYLLAGTTQPKHAVFGQHHRILISDDGSRVVRSEPLSKSALVIPIEPPEANGLPQALIVSHLVSSTPIETHVLVSLQHHMRVLVATDRGDWLVDGAKITFLGPREE